MAVTWKSTLEVIDRPSKRIRVTSVRTDGEDEDTFSCEAKIDPADVPGSKVKAAQAIRNAHLAKAAEEAADDALLAGWADDLDAWLEGQEA